MIPTAAMATHRVHPSQQVVSQLEQKRLINQKAPISRLAPEILSAIFSELRDSSLSVLHTGEFFGVPLCHEAPTAWIKVTHVCYHWRRVALGMPLLWTNIGASVNRQELARTMFQRSKECPVTFIVDGFKGINGPNSGCGTTAIWLFPDLEDYLLRCRILSLRRFHPVDLFFWLSGVDAPRLEYLTIGQGTVSRDLFILSDSCLRAISLRRLVLENCPVDWNSALLRNLTHLELIGMPEDYRLTCREFIGFLASIPAIEVLNLCRFLREEVPIHGQPNHGPADKINLGKLQSLYLSSGLWNVAQFLDSCTFPLCCRLNILAMVDAEVVHTAQILPLVAMRLKDHFHCHHHAQTPSSILSLSFDASPEELVIQGFDEIITENQIPKDDALFSFTLTNCYEYPPEPVLERFIDSIPLKNLEALTVLVDEDVDFEFSASFFRNCFGQIQSLRSISLKAEASTFFEALLPGPTATPFPALSAVALSEVNDYNVIVNSLRQRKLSNTRPLEQILLLEDGDISEHIIASLQGLVHVVLIQENDHDSSSSSSI